MSTTDSHPRGQQEASQAQPNLDRIMQLGLGFWGSKTLLSAVELGVFTALANNVMTGKVLSEHLGLHPRSACDFFDALVALGMLHRNGDQYVNTPETAAFPRGGSSTSQRGMQMRDEKSISGWSATPATELPEKNSQR